MTILNSGTQGIKYKKQLEFITIGQAFRQGLSSDSPSQHHVCIGSLEGKAADVGDSVPSRQGSAADLVGEMHRWCCRGVFSANGSSHIGIDFCQVQNASCPELAHPAGNHLTVLDIR